MASVTGGREDGAIRETAAVVVYEHPELPKLRALVEAARARLAELEAAYTIEKAKVDGLQARLFSRLRPLHQERERLRLIVSYRRQFLDTLLRQGEEEISFRSQNPPCYFQNVSTLAEIESAAESLPPQEQQELLLFLATRLHAAGGVLPPPRDIPTEQIEKWIADDEAGHSRFLAGA